jgi:subtilisin-like proprotein convertase family protein
MKNITKTLAGTCLAGAMLFGSLFMFSGAAFAQNAEHQRIYNNPAIFDRLSGAARSMLDAELGPRPGEKRPVDEKGSAPRSGLGKIGSGSGGTLFSALANNLVNDAAADATARDTQSETAIILGSGSKVIAGFNDSGSYSGVSTPDGKFTGFSTSADGGSTWFDGGTLPTNPTGDAGDPVLARNEVTGRVYLSTLQFSGNGLAVFRSDDDGATWMAPTQGAPGATGFQDKEWIAVDNFPGAGQGNVYLAFRDFASTGGGIRFTRSLDHGDTFLHGPRGLLIKAGSPSNVQGAFVAVGPDHAVYVFWYDQNFTPRQIRMRKSIDQGLTFGAEISVTTLTSTVTNGGLTLVAGFRSNSFPQVAVNPVSGHLYVVYNDPTTATTGGDRGNIFFRMSTDGGATWSAAVGVNDDGTSRAQYFPAIAVTPDGSALSVTWYDNRNDPADRNIERWGVTATISGASVTFGPNFRISTQFPPVFGVDPVVNTVYMGDYDMMAADNSNFYTLWGDNRDQSIAVPSRKNANVRFAKFSLAGPGPILDLASSTLTGGNGNGVIDFNECNRIFVTVKNNGSATATGVTGTLSTSTPEVTVLQATKPYPDLAPGASGTNSTAFTIFTSPSFVCGTPVQFTLTLNYTGGPEVVNFTLQSGSPGTASQFDNNTPTPLPDVTTTDIPIAVSGFTGPVAKVTLSLHLLHTFDGDLIISLISPDGTLVTLSNRRGSSGDNFGAACSPQSLRTTFDDAAATAISTGAAPFVGTFRPESPLTAFNGKSDAQVNGTWTLRIQDTATLDVGTFQCASLFVSPTVCSDGGGMPTVDAGADRFICVGQTVTLGGSPTASGGTPPYTFSWTPTTGLDDPSAANPKARPIVTTTYTVTVTDSRGCEATDEVTIAVHDGVFLANQFIHLNAPALGEGNLHSNTNINFEVGRPTVVKGNLTAVNNIIIRSKNTVVGDATAGNHVSILGNAKVTGTVTIAPVAVTPLPTLSFAAGLGLIHVSQNKSLTLPPGAYASVSVLSGAKLFLSSGVYYMSKLVINSSAIVTCDVSAGPITINVVDNLSFGDKAKVIITPTGPMASAQVGFLTMTKSTVSIGSRAVIRGAIIAPEALVTLGQYSQFKGSICAQKIDVLNGASFFHHSSASLPKEDESEAGESGITGNEQPVTSYELAQNYPNPFNPSTMISFALPEAGKVTVSIFNATGQLVRQLVDHEMPAGRQILRWNARDQSGKLVAAGVYLYRIVVQGKDGNPAFTETRRMTLLK